MLVALLCAKWGSSSYIKYHGLFPIFCQPTKLLLLRTVVTLQRCLQTNKFAILGVVLS